METTLAAALLHLFPVDLLYEGPSRTLNPQRALQSCLDLGASSERSLERVRAALVLAGSSCDFCLGGG